MGAITADKQKPATYYKHLEKQYQGLLKVAEELEDELEAQKKLTTFVEAGLEAADAKCERLIKELRQLKGIKQMYYTIGRTSTYKPALREDPTLKKAVGSYALSLYRALIVRNEAQEGKYPELPSGSYSIYELPECTDNIVKNEALTKATLIGKEFSVLKDDDRSKPLVLDSVQINPTTLEVAKGPIDDETLARVSTASKPNPHPHNHVWGGPPSDGYATCVRCGCRENTDEACTNCDPT